MGALNGNRVGWVTRVDGWLFMQKSGQGAWKVARPSQEIAIGDLLQTSSQSRACIEFSIGGKVGINPGVTIRVSGRRDVEWLASPWEKFVNQIQTLHAKFTRQDEQFKLQTESTVLGALRG